MREIQHTSDWNESDWVESSAGEDRKVWGIADLGWGWGMEHTHKLVKKA